VHGETVERTGPGRTALAIAGLELDDVERGMVLTNDRQVVASTSIIAALRRSPRSSAPLQLHVGTAQVPARVSRSMRQAAPLDDGRVITALRLDRPIAIAPGDHFVLRRPSPARAESGGVVLDPQPPRGASRRRYSAARLGALAAAATPTQRDAARLDLHGAIRDRLAPDVEATIAELAATVIERAADTRPLADLRTALVRELRRTVAIEPRDAAVAASRALDTLEAAGQITREGDSVRDARRARLPRDRALDVAMDRLVDLVDVPAPPSLDEAARIAGCTDADIRQLESHGRIVRVGDNLAWSRAAYERLERQAVEIASREPLTPAALRDVTGTSRKYVMALLEDLDRRAVLRRTQSGHVPGPRAPVRSG
jgi:selenocysteine-specific elongation factor